jgi:hypothetical protein
MYSIKGKLNLLLISTLMAISLLFIVYMVVLHLFGSDLTPEAYAQIISALATTLFVILTLGLRFIDDVLNRYEKFAMPRIVSLRCQLDEGGTKSELRSCHLFNIPNRSKGLIGISSDLKKHGRFFLTKLYPKEPLNKIARISSDLDKFLALVKDIVPYWEKSDFDTFLEFSILSGTVDFPCSKNLREAREAVAKLNREKPELINQIRTLREKTLLEIEKAIGELNSFLEAN